MDYGNDEQRGYAKKDAILRFDISESRHQDERSVQAVCG